MMTMVTMVTMVNTNNNHHVDFLSQSTSTHHEDLMQYIHMVKETLKPENTMELRFVKQTEMLALFRADNNEKVQSL